MVYLEKLTHIIKNINLEKYKGAFNFSKLKNYKSAIHIIKNINLEKCKGAFNFSKLKNYKPAIDVKKVKDTFKRLKTYDFKKRLSSFQIKNLKQNITKEKLLEKSEQFKSQLNDAFLFLKKKSQKLNAEQFESIKNLSLQDVLQKIRSFQNTLSIQQILNYTNILLFIFIAYYLGKVISTIVDNTLLSTPTLSRAVSYQEELKIPVRKLNEFHYIIEQNVFGVKVKEEKVVEQVVNTGNIVESDSLIIKKIIDDLRLDGTLIWGKENKFAMIQHRKTGNQETFSINDTIFETKAILVKIEDKKVWLKIGNEAGILKYEEEELPVSIASEAPETKVPPPKKEDNQNKKSSYVITKTSKNNFDIPRTEIDKALSNLSSLIMQARVIPIFKDGKTDGFKIKKISKDSLYDKLGLKNNDIIKSVNGELIDGVEKAMSLLTLLKSERQINLEIVRNEITENLSYEIK